MYFDMFKDGIQMGMRGDSTPADKRRGNWFCEVSAAENLRKETQRYRAYIFFRELRSSIVYVNSAAVRKAFGSRRKWRRRKPEVLIRPSPV
ncbi:hypothetical protein EVAR_30604_1 [Eumeta japonica]|uniref:Uncharacterized protein n=1 Tax=Eumeta variegata TaxID=151549 RepID=A0A4C1W811_EUMVA|nr:hypothetical protein EVAR_30604_1 [Eumeta japonica]